MVHGVERITLNLEVYGLLQVALSGRRENIVFESIQPVSHNDTHHVWKVYVAQAAKCRNLDDN